MENRLRVCQGQCHCQWHSPSWWQAEGKSSRLAVYGDRQLIYAQMQMQMQLQMLIAATVKDTITTPTATSARLRDGSSSQINGAEWGSLDGRLDGWLDGWMAGACAEHIALGGSFICKCCGAVVLPQMKCQHAEMQREHRIANYG